MRARTLTLVALAGAGLVAGLLVLRGRPLDPAREGATQALPRPSEPAASEPSSSAPATSQDLPELPTSLQGTQVDGELMVDANGKFVPTRESLTVFDYFLSATGEESDDRIRSRIVAYIRGTLPDPAAADAEALLDTYLRYRERMRTLTMSGTPPADLDRRFQWIREERRSAFGAELAETLFGEEERVVSLDLERRAVLSDASLSRDEKARRLEEIESRLPDPVRQARRRASAPARVAREVEALRAAGASEREVFVARERELGSEAAERLASLDRENDAWQARIDAFRAERARILADASLSAAEREARADALLAERFDERERLRVRALEQSNAGAHPQPGSDDRAAPAGP